MGLVLGMKKGNDVYIGEHKTRIRMREIFSPTDFLIGVTTDGINYTNIQITEGKTVEILPGIIISCAKPGTAEIARVSIQAPRDVSINRGNIVRRESLSIERNNGV